MRRAQRLTHRLEFAAVYRDGRPYRSGLLILRALATNRPTTRFGLTTSRTLGNAVARNRVRRQLKAAASSLGVEAGWDVVVNARSGAESAGYWRLRSSLSGLLTKAGIANHGSAS
jgi:ribonuclease P protein component